MVLDFIPVPIRALRWRYRWLTQTAAFAENPAGAIWKLLRWTAGEMLHREIAFVTPDGTPFVSAARNFTALVLYIANDRDPLVQEFIRGRLGPGSVFVDIGANIGAYTIRAGQLAGDTGRVIAIEAHPKTFGYLQRNIASSGLKNIDALQVAVGEAPGSVDMSYSDKNPGETHVTPEAGAGTVRVAMQTLDAILSARGIERADYIKIDVEGYELQVLKGARETLRKNPHAAVQLEMDSRHARRYGNSLAGVAQLLTGMGYVPHCVLKGGNLRRVEDAANAGYSEVLWMRPDGV